jgi:hypothetical protein
MALLLKIVVVLGLPTAVAALIVRLTAIVNAMVANKTTFPTPPIPLTQVQADVDDLAAAEAIAKTHAIGATAKRDEKRKVVVADAKQLHAYVQQIASASPEHADVIAQAAAMTVRKHGAHSKSDLAVTHVVAGSVKLVAKTAKTNKAHDWQWSLDGKSWTGAAPTTQAHTTLVGLQSGVMTYFRHRPVSKTGAGDWSVPVSLVVS